MHWMCPLAYRHHAKRRFFFCLAFYFKWKYFVLIDHILSETICLFCFCVLFSWQKFVNLLLLCKAPSKIRLSERCRKHGSGHMTFIHRGYSNVWSEYDFYFIEWSEKMYISWVPKARMKYTFFHFTRWNKSHIHHKHLNFLFIIYITFDRKDASLAFARESLTRNFFPWRHDVHVLFCLVTLDMTSETRTDV